MAENLNKVLDIKVNYAEAFKAIDQYKAKIAEMKKSEEMLQAQREFGMITDEECRNGLVLTKEATKEYQTAIRELEKEIRNEVKQQDKKEGSLKSLRAQLSNTTKAYDELSRAERNGAQGKELQEKINAITAELKGAEEETGRYYRNVGNYESAIKNVFGNTAFLTGLDKAKTGVMGVKGAMDLAGKTPLLFTITSIVTILQKLFASTGANEDQMAKLNRVMQPLNVVMDAFTVIIEGLADLLLTVSDAVVDVATRFSDWIGLTDNMNQKTKQYIELEKAKLDLIKQTREANEASATTEQEVSELRAKIAQKDKYNAQERKAMLEQVIAKEKDVADTKRKIAEENLRILEEEGERTMNSAEFEEQLSKARIEVTKATTDYNNKVRELNGQMAELNNAEATQAKQAQDQVKKAQEEKAKAIAEAKKAEMQAIRQAEDAMLAILSDGLMKQQEMINVQYDRQIEDLKARLDAEKTLTIEAKQAINDTILALETKRSQELEKASMEQAQKDAERRARELAEQDKAEQAYKALLQAELDEKKRIADQEVAIEMAKYDAIASITGGLSSLLAEYGEDNKAMAQMAKVLALGEIAVNTGKAIAAGTAQAMAVPFPANIGAIATTVTTVLANMATAIKTVKGAKFATGGFVSGSGTGTSDSIPAHLSDGESVLTARATSMFSPILSPLNVMGGGVPINVAGSSNTAIGEDMLARSFAKGLQSMPAPIVSVKEISNVSNRVKIVESLGEF